MEEIVTAAKEAGADGFIRRLEDGTRITADGGSISESQKQLPTIARVMLANPPTSNIGTYTEMRSSGLLPALRRGGPAS